MARYELIVIGDEILIGQTLDTNSRYIARRLSDNGMRLHFISVVEDDKTEITTAITQARQRASVIIITGGLGPTSDDYTRPVLAECLDDKLIWRQDLADTIKARFINRGVKPTPGWETMAYFPSRALPIPNAHGAAPGIHYSLNDIDIFAIPGVPVEMQGMLENYILPQLLAKRKGIFQSCIFKTVGAGESHLADLIGNPTIFRPATLAFLPSIDQGVTLRLSCEGNDSQEVLQTLDKGANIIKTVLKNYIYATQDVPLESVIIDILRKRNWKLALAESCTGGMISSRITSIPGASDVFERGFITYSNQAKQELLGVEPGIITKYGAVSENCARAMADGARESAKVDIAVSVTGIAGPGGGTEQKPVGLVYIGIADKFGCEVKKFNFIGDREGNRRRASLAALTILYNRIKDNF